VFTQQAQLIANQFGNQPQGAMQSLANCAQPLATRGPVQFDAAARSRPPRGGVIPARSSSGDIRTAASPNGNALDDYYNGLQPINWNQYPGTDWNGRFFTNQTDNSFHSGDNNYWGGDTAYGDNYFFNAEYNNPQQFNSQAFSDYNYYDTYYNLTNNTLNFQNISEWYTQQFVDQSYNDFSTNIDATSNFYQQSVNNFAGDNYFDNTVTTNTTVNNNVVNEGDVYNNSGVYMDARKTFITENNTKVTDLRQFIENLFLILVQGGGKGAEPNPRPPPNVPIQKAGKMPVVMYDKAVSGVVDPETCTVTLQYAQAKARVNPG
jgi:hypothetical protein